MKKYTIIKTRVFKKGCKSEQFTVQALNEADLIGKFEEITPSLNDPFETHVGLDETYKEKRWYMNRFIYFTWTEII